MRQGKVVHAILASSVAATALHGMHAQANAPISPVLQRCVEYSKAGDLVKAQVSAASFQISVVRPNGQELELTGKTPAAVTAAQPKSRIVPCQLVVSVSSNHAALAITTDAGIGLELVDLATGALTRTILVPKEFPIQFAFDPVGYLRDSDDLAVSQIHYLPAGEPEVATRVVSPDGLVSSTPHKALGARYAEAFPWSFDFRGGRVWFLCSVYSARVDRQPGCTLTSASLSESSTPALEIGPPPDDRVIGSGQPSLGFPSAHEAVLLADKRSWLYNFGNRSFRQLNLPETPQHIRWSEAPGGPKFSSDGLFAAVPVYLFHAPLFEEGEVSHGTKLVVIDMTKLEILKTIQPPDKQDLVDFVLCNGGKSLTLIASWGKDWQSFDIPTGPSSRAK